MSRRSINEWVKRVVLFDPKAAVTDNTAQVSAIVDTAGYDAVMLMIQTGTLSDADATFATTIDHGDVSNLSDAAAVASTDLTAALSTMNFTFADDSTTKAIGYIGMKRYVRVTVTPSANTGNLFLAGAAILSLPTVSPAV